ncbi:Carbohydrate deacetylase [Nymphon striatum]|nr:Carbohydrate deacetylase [Nymphon striatum]
MMSSAKSQTGLHFNITEGRPLITTCSSGMLNEKGYFLGKKEFHEAVELKKVILSEVQKELEAQIKRFTDITGKLPRVAEMFGETLNKFKIEWTRVPIEPDIKTCTWLGDDQKLFFSSVIDNAIQAKEIFKRHNLKFADPFIGLKTMGSNLTLERVKNQIQEEFGKKRDHSKIICELMVHPGYKARENEGGCGEGPDLFARSAEREHELNFLKSAKFQNFLKETNITLSSYKYNI